MFSSKPDDTEPIFANSRGQSREVTVAADQAEPIEPAPVQQVHCVNDERAVTGIFPYRITSTLSDYLKDICVRHDVQCKSLVI